MKQKDKQNKNQTMKGSQGFETYYSEIYASRWPELKKAFYGETQSVEYKVPGSQKSYFLDAASILAALCLPVKDANDILDLCAAPGGKTLVLASRMNSDAKLCSNERSSDRKHRLSVVVETCLPEEISKRILVSCSDGSTWCTRQTECFDSILLDAPCSSERHVINDEKYLKDWSLSRIKTVTTEQWALLSSAYRLLRTGGYLLYSTCALSPKENDEMIERLIKKYNKTGESFKFCMPEPQMEEINLFAKFNLPLWEKTKYGFQILPDTQNGAGPIYFCLIQKLLSV